MIPDLPHEVGTEMHEWAKDLWPLHRSITGNGVRETLAYLAGVIGALEIHEVASGTRALDWTVPDEWEIRAAYIETMDGQRVVDLADSTLHVVGYSAPVDAVMSLTDLRPHLHSLPEQPDAIPFVTSYYERRWGFCLTHRSLEALDDGPFRVKIDSVLKPGYLTYADLVIPGDTEEEILFSTYVCHPAMANNELSGPVLTAALARWLTSVENRRFTYRFVFVPETIGSIVYLSRHLEHLRRTVRAGWVVTCVGDEREYSILSSRLGNTLADRVGEEVLAEVDAPVRRFSFLERGSDERQWCAPGVDLPVASIMRSKYWEYPEYHTSLDDLHLVTATGLAESLDVYANCVRLLEANRNWVATVLGEPQMSRRNLYPSLSQRGSASAARCLMNTLAYCDGRHDLIDIARVTGLPCSEVRAHIDTLASAGLIAVAETTSRPG